ncbi:hypothetical protein FDECE_8468 [Fusarium decemcellulare]|nr:hypothetical protein FDECE_8468 [Fusarium decemcellulare]
MDNTNGVSLSAQDRLKDRIDRRLPAEDQWYSIWTILFRESSQGEKPYLDNALEEVISIVRDACNIEGSPVISGFLQSQNLPKTLATDVQRLMTGLLDEFRVYFSQKRCDQDQTETFGSETNEKTHDLTLQTNIETAHCSSVNAFNMEDVEYEPPVQSRSSIPSGRLCGGSGSNNSEAGYAPGPFSSSNCSNSVSFLQNPLAGQVFFNGTTTQLGSTGFSDSCDVNLDDPLGIYKGNYAQSVNETWSVSLCSSDNMASTDALVQTSEGTADPDILSIYLLQQSNYELKQEEW